MLGTDYKGANQSGGKMNDRFKFRFFETYNNTMLDCKDYDFYEILESGK